MGESVRSDPEPPAGTACRLAASSRVAPCRLTRVWNGLDQSAGFIIQSSPGGFGLEWMTNSPTQRILDWAGSRNVRCASHIRDLRQFLLIVTLTSEVLPSYLRLYLHIVVYFYMLILQGIWYYLLCCVRIGLDWIQILDHQLDWTGLGSVAHGLGLDWIVSTQSIPYSATDPFFTVR